MSRKQRNAGDVVPYNPLNPLAGRRTVAQGERAIELMHQRTILELMMNRFQWEGFPPEINVRWLELSIAEFGLAVFFQDRRLDRFFAMRGSPTGQLNLVGDPVQYIVYGNGAYPPQTLGIKDCVPIWGNYTRIPDTDIIQIYAKKFANIDRTIEINAQNARRGKVMKMNENSQLSFANIDKQINDGAPTIKITDALSINDMYDVIDFGINPATITELSILRGRLWNELLTLLGINNANQDKKERLVAAEVSGNDDSITSLRAIHLNARRAACDQINDMYGLDVSVDYAHEDMSEVATSELVDQQGGPGGNAGAASKGTGK